MMKRPTPAELGYFMPAEWERHAATWLSWPKDPLTWPDRVPRVQEIFLQMMAALRPMKSLTCWWTMLRPKALFANAARFPAADNIHFKQLQTVDSWIRDYGPNFLVSSRQAPGVPLLAYNDWIFNAWGNKYEELKQDDAIPALLEAELGVPRFEPGIVMEGGSIEVNGLGLS